MSLMQALISAMAASAGGGGGAVVALTNQDIGAFDSGAASCSYSLQSNGVIQQSTSVVGVLPIGNWISPTSAAPGSYECRADLVSGTLSSGTTGSWLALTSSRAWSLTRLSPGSSSAELTISIRLSGVTLATCTVNLQSDVA